MKLYSCNFSLGQALIKANDPEIAKQYAEKEWGVRHGPYKISEATKSDRDWVESMGGMVHEA